MFTGNSESGRHSFILFFLCSIKSVKVSPKKCRAGQVTGTTHIFLFWPYGEAGSTLDFGLWVWILLSFTCTQSSNSSFSLSWYNWNTTVKVIKPLNHPSTTIIVIPNVIIATSKNCFYFISCRKTIPKDAKTVFKLKYYLKLKFTKLEILCTSLQSLGKIIHE